MTILLFVIILAVLILVHELGHFIVAKIFGIRIDEFGIGFPPRILKLFSWRETDFTLNSIPFGGFVKIFGENPDEESLNGPDKQRSIISKPKYVQAAVLFAGVFFNFLFAWFLISIAFIQGMPSVFEDKRTENDRLAIVGVTPNSPAEQSGIEVGDKILSLSSGDNVLEEISISSVSDFISQQSESITVSLLRGEEEIEIEVLGSDSLIEGKKAIGVSMGYVGLLKYSFFESIVEGGKRSVFLVKEIFVGLKDFLVNIVLGQANFSQVSGPVGIVKLVGDASNLGFLYLLNFTAFISLNLAVINLIPFPALDGGRLLFILIEALSGKRINHNVANNLNAIGFLLLIVLLLVVTFYDFAKIFGF